MVNLYIVDGREESSNDKLPSIGDYSSSNLTSIHMHALVLADVEDIMGNLTILMLQAHKIARWPLLRKLDGLERQLDLIEKSPFVKSRDMGEKYETGVVYVRHGIGALRESGADALQELFTTRNVMAYDAETLRPLGA